MNIYGIRSSSSSSSATNERSVAIPRPQHTTFAASHYTAVLPSSSITPRAQMHRPQPFGTQTVGLGLPFDRFDSGFPVGSYNITPNRSLPAIPNGFPQPSSKAAELLPPLTLWPPPRFSDQSLTSKESFGLAKQPGQQGRLVKQELDRDRDLDSSGDGMGERKSEVDNGDELFNAYFNLDGMGVLNSLGTKKKANGKNANDADSNESEAESSINEIVSSLPALHQAYLIPSMEIKEGVKASISGDYASFAGPSRHCRSLSVDSCILKTNCGSNPLMLPPSPRLQPIQRSGNGTLGGTLSTFSLEFGNCEFTSAEMKKIMANEKLAEMARSDPKRVKRILANRQSAARSKERKLRYISELEHKVKTLESETAALSAQVTLVQRDSTSLTSKNNGLKFRLQAMEQQAQLKDALNGALNAEVQRLKLATAEVAHSQLSNGMEQQLTLNSQLLHLQLELEQQKHHHDKKKDEDQQWNIDIVKHKSDQIYNLPC